MTQRSWAIVINLLASSLSSAQQVPLTVNFKMTDVDFKPSAGVPVRLVTGVGKGWQGANSGNRFVTADNGEAHFTTTGILDKQWCMQPFFNFSIPVRMRHMMIAVELEQILPLDDRGKQLIKQFLYTMDIYSNAAGSSTADFVDLYDRDRQGQFTERIPRAPSSPGTPAWKLAELGGMVLQGAGYKPWDFSLNPDVDDPAGKRWMLKLGLMRQSPPMRR